MLLRKRNTERVRAYVSPETHSRMKKFTFRNGKGTLEIAYNELIQEVISPDGYPTYVPVSKEVREYVSELARELNMTEKEVMELIFKKSIKRKRLASAF